MTVEVCGRVDRMVIDIGHTIRVVVKMPVEPNDQCIEVASIQKVTVVTKVHHAAPVRIKVTCEARTIARSCVAIAAKMPVEPNDQRIRAMSTQKVAVIMKVHHVAPVRIKVTREVMTIARSCVMRAHSHLIVVQVPSHHGASTHFNNFLNLKVFQSSFLFSELSFFINSTGPIL